MTLHEPLASTLSPHPTLAHQRAQQLLAENLHAIELTQPRLREALFSIECGVQWVFARDGSLTCQDDAGKWWAGCSLPKRAGTAMLRNLELPGVVGCLLAPGHAGEMTAALLKLEPTQAIIVIQPEARSLKIALSCAPFAADISAHRLWFAWGENWVDELDSLFTRHPGLPTPDRFIRTPALPEAVSSKLIPAAEAVIARQSAQRTVQLQALLAAATSAKQTGPVCVVARSRFRLWDDAGPTMAAVIPTGSAGAGVTRIDPDDPTSASSLYLALAASDARAVVTHDRCRSQLPSVIPVACPIITWITTPTIPPANVNGPTDRLVLADAGWLDLATAAGWEARRVTVAGWPGADRTHLSATARQGVALIADTRSLETPKASLDLSSHHLLWEMIREELLSDPFILGPDVDRFLKTRRARAGIAEEGFAAAWFIERLILPAYQQGLAKTLIDAQLPVSLYGDGWGDIDAYRSAWAGSVQTREAFEAVTSKAAVMIYPWPGRYAHQMDSLGATVVAPGRRAGLFLRDIREALDGSTAGPILPRPISLKIVESLLSDPATVY